MCTAPRRRRDSQTRARKEREREREKGNDGIIYDNIMVAAALMTSAEQKTAPVNDIGGEENAVMTTTTKTKTHVDDASVVKVEEQRKIERLPKEEAGIEETMCRNEIASTSLNVEKQQQKRKAGELPIETKFGHPSTLRERGEDTTTMTAAATTTTTTTTTGIVAAEFDENGIRKSKRSVKPKILFDESGDYEHVLNKKKKANGNSKNKENNTKKRKMPASSSASAAAAVAAAAAPTDTAVVKLDFEELRAKRAYIGKKVEVFWHGEREYHRGTIVNYDYVVRKHQVKYDNVMTNNGEGEETLDFIDIEIDKLEWCDDEKDEKNNDNAKTKNAKNKVTLPAQGKMSEIVAQMAENWPKVGTHVWGRVKGHGWWPGICKGKESSTSRTIAFFDDSMAKCLRADLVPYTKFLHVLKKSKASKAFENAVKRSMESAQKHFSEKLKKRVAKKQEEFAEIRKKHAIAAKKQQLQEQHAIKNRALQNNKNKKAKNKHNNRNNTNKVIRNNKDFASVDLNGSSSAARLARLGKHFDALKDRVAPLAIAASQHLRMQLQLQENTGGENRMAQMTERERVVLLEELESLKSFLVNSGRHLEAINAENPEDVAMYGYNDDFDNQIANATFMTVVGEDIVGKTGEGENLDDPDDVKNNVDDDNDVIVDDYMIKDLGLSADDVVQGEDEDEDGKPEETTAIADTLDPTPLDALLFQEENKEKDGEQPKTPHYPTRDDGTEENEIKHTSSDDQTERNDSDDNDASLPLNENSKSVGGDIKDQEEEVRNTASKVSFSLEEEQNKTITTAIT